MEGQSWLKSIKEKPGKDEILDQNFHDSEFVSPSLQNKPCAEI